MYVVSSGQGSTSTDGHQQWLELKTEFVKFHKIHNNHQLVMSHHPCNSSCGCSIFASWLHTAVVTDRRRRVQYGCGSHTLRLVRPSACSLTLRLQLGHVLHALQLPSCMCYVDNVYRCDALHVGKIITSLACTSSYAVMASLLDNTRTRLRRHSVTDYY